MERPRNFRGRLFQSLSSLKARRSSELRTDPTGLSQSSLRPLGGMNMFQRCVAFIPRA